MPAKRTEIEIDPKLVIVVEKAYQTDTGACCCEIADDDEGVIAVLYGDTLAHARERAKYCARDIVEHWVSWGFESKPSLK